ncbi:hypothetical protein SAHL_11625 [Salinisphaera orenii YIM 95161]|uniref:Uncharacterized protein n=1 Tax=Salinisphaera orenii YIM 95161 TaxID=1051139 RepID=A0A423PNS4_9GAMM|nr:hypothetical protein SAHL_11625 [Salinisphaera halophila YIM 95161]
MPSSMGADRVIAQVAHAGVEIAIGVVADA